MADEKIKTTPDMFKKRLAAGDYADVTGARKAIGRANGWSDRQRLQAREFADAYFKDAPKKKAKPAKVSKVKVAKAAKPEKTPKAKSTILKPVRDHRPSEAEQLGEVLETDEPVDAFAHINSTTNSVRNTLDTLAITATLGTDAARVAETATKAQQVLEAVIDETLNIIRKSRGIEEPKPARAKNIVAKVTVAAPTVDNDTLTRFGAAVKATSNGIAAEIPTHTALASQDEESAPLS